MNKLFAVVLGAVLAWPALAQAPIVLRFSHVVSEQAPKGVGAELFRQKVEQRLAGKVRVEVYPNSQLFDDDLVLPALLRGDVQMAAPSLSKFHGYTPKLLVFDLPFLFADAAAVNRFQDGEAGRKLLDSMVDKGIQGLAYWNNGLRVISATRPVRSPVDAAGLTFRIEPSPVIEAQYQTLDAPTLKLPFSQLHDAVQSGLVDAQENTWSNIVSQQLHTLHKDFTETGHSFLGYMVVTSAEFWRALPDDVRTELEAILAEVTAEVNHVALQQAQSSRQAVVDAGGQVRRLTPIERELWLGQLKPLRQRFEAEIGREIIDAAAAAGGE